MINTITNRAKAVYSTLQLLKEELHHLEEVLMKCKYHKWVINKVLFKQENKKKTTNKRQNLTMPQAEKSNIVVPYSQGSVINMEYKYTLKEDEPWKIW